MSNPKEQFIADLYPAARKIGQETGMSWELTLAQAARETGWGEKVLPGTHNIFSIKADAGWQGDSKEFRVPEFINGKWVQQDASFRAYPSIEDALGDRVGFLRDNPRYAGAGLFDEGTRGNLEREAEALQRAGYATDPQYVRQLAAIFEGPTMQRGIRLAEDRARGDGQQSLVTEPGHPGNDLFNELGRRIAEQTGQAPSDAILTGVTKEAVQNGITSVSKLARVDVDGDYVFLRGTNDIDRARVDLSRPGPEVGAASDAIATGIREAEGPSLPSRNLQQSI